MEALRLKPEFKNYIWGGTKLRDEYNKNCNYERVAESWELACHKDGNSIIENGEYSGLTLEKYIERVGKKVLGSACSEFENFPILIKLIDARDNLSVQVHPNNDYAMDVEGNMARLKCGMLLIAMRVQACYMALIKISQKMSLKSILKIIHCLML